MSSAAAEAWDKEGGTRRPITLRGGEPGDNENGLIVDENEYEE